VLSPTELLGGFASYVAIEPAWDNKHYPFDQDRRTSFPDTTTDGSGAGRYLPALFPGGRLARFWIEPYRMLVPHINGASSTLACQISNRIRRRSSRSRTGGNVRWLGDQAGALKSYEMRPAGR
jgi:hypothetical protein